MAESFAGASAGKPFDPYKALREAPLRSQQPSSAAGVSGVESPDRLSESGDDLGSFSFEHILAGVVDKEIDDMHKIDKAMGQNEGLQRLSEIREIKEKPLEVAKREEAAHFDPRPNISGFYDSKSTPHDWSTKN